MQASAPEAESAAASAPRRPTGESSPFQWGLVGWAALVGTLTGLAIVGFHELFGFINNFLYGPFVEGLLVIGRSPVAASLADGGLDLPPLAPEAGTPLKSMVQLGLDGLGWLASSPPPAVPEPQSPPADTLADWLTLWPVFVVPTLGGLAVGVLRWLAGSIGPGIPSLLAMADGAAVSAPRLPLLRLVAASLSLGSGASLGPEGPSVESGGNLGLWVASRAGLTPQSQKALVAAGIAAGLAAGFKAPIAGVFFAFEGSFNAIQSRSSLRAVLVAAVASTLVTQLVLGDSPILRLPAYDVRSPLELPLYLGLGVVASLLSLALVRLMALGRHPRVNNLIHQLPPGLATALGGAAVGGLALLFPEVLGVGYDTIESLLGQDDAIPLLTLLVVMAVKLLATTLSNACGFVGGGFAPALFLGAVLGNVYGQVLGEAGLHLPVAEPPAYAMVGMAAVLAGSARAPITSLLLLFELTRDIRIVLPLMAAAGLSAALVERWQGIRAADLLGRDGVEERRRAVLASVSVLEALEPEAPLVLPASTATAAALNLLIDVHGHCLLVAEQGRMVGLINLADLQRGLQRERERSADGQPCGSTLRDCLRSELVWLPGQANLCQLEDQLLPGGLRQVPVFAVSGEGEALLPQGVPRGGLPEESLLGLASRDGLARAAARRLQLNASDT
ncbi:MAG: chloride channel protein [Cyanobacteria bacterium K_Offshore_surface_m2_239]|nr:chloride channel protein [Cyanobacteria bacterium K_Offshore_surface_m2_239]